jgi:signal peptidase I
LLVGDWLFVNKLRYGPHIPFIESSLPGYAAPKRGDVVVFISPPQVPAIRITPDDVTPTLVKRIVGVAGDTVLMRHGRLLVNGVAVPSPNSFVLPDSIADAPQSLFVWQHRIEISDSRFGRPVAAPSLHEWGPLRVPDGSYFMMGDNRDDSVDSRYYGPVPRANLRGTPMLSLDLTTSAPRPRSGGSDSVPGSSDLRRDEDSTIYFETVITPASARSEARRTSSM